MIVAVVLMIFVVVFSTLDLLQDVKAAMNEVETDDAYIEMQATAYCIDGTTATGTHTRKGICAGKREWFGKTAVVYADNHGEIGDLIGIYKVEDTGGDPIRNGKVLDIWVPSYDEAIQFGRQKVHVYILNEE
jgi:3D (Asp-Asp-Asp) domain-containing protein